MTYGRQIIGNASGRPVRVSADGSPEYKPGGVTIDWSTVTAATDDVTLPDGVEVPSGGKYLAMGQIVVKIDATGYFGPYNSGVSDGRQSLERGNAYILDESVLQSGSLGIAGLEAAANHPAVFEGGLVWKARLLIDPSGTATKPSTSAFETAFPRIRYAQ